jgi:gluconokinase
MSTHHSQTPLLLMGVSGSGKTVIGRLLADRLRMPFLDADDLHPAENVQKMRLGRPLTDTDRGPWLHAVAGEIARRALDGQGVVVACSALKRAYRDRLRAACPGLRLVQLAGPPEVIRRRLEARTGHFMPADLLDSQLATLEPPEADERPLVIDLAPPPDEIVERIVAALTPAP